MTKFLVPWMKPEDPVLWVLFAIVVVYAIGGAARSFAAHRRASAKNGASKRLAPP